MTDYITVVVQADVKEYINNDIPGWIPDFIKKPFVNWLMGSFVEKVRNDA